MWVLQRIKRGLADFNHHNNYTSQTFSIDSQEFMLTRCHFNVRHASQTSYCRSPGAVVKAACLESNGGFKPALAFKFRRNHVSSPLTRKIQYCAEPPGSRGTMFGLRPPGLKFRILCLEGSVISPSSGVLLAQFSLHVHVHKGSLNFIP